MLLDDVVAAEPNEVIPVAQLILHVGPTRLATMDPELALIPIRSAAGDLADGAVLDAFHAFEIAGLMAALRAGHNVQVLLGGIFVGGQHLANAGSVGAD